MSTQSYAESLPQAAVRRYAILDTFPEAPFERLTRLTANIFGAPIALVSLLDQNRQWFKSSYGIDVCETSREVSFCARAVEQSDVFVIPDASADVRFADNPLVVGEPNIRFYAGAPLTTPEGERIGTLCIIDTLPRRPLLESEKAILRDLAEIVVDAMEFRLAARTAVQTAGAGE